MKAKLEAENEERNNRFQTDQEVVWWKPEDPETLIGTIEAAQFGPYGYNKGAVVFDQKTGTSKPEPPIWRLFITGTDGLVYGVSQSHTVLQNRLAELSPEAGQTIAIQYLGKVRGKSFTYADYVVVTGDAEVAPAPARSDDTGYDLLLDDEEF